MKITPIAYTQFIRYPESVNGTRLIRENRTMEDEATDIDFLHEFAGRACYKSWEKPNPKTDTNESYLDHIDEVGHLSILEHGQVSFYVEDVSRSLLLELERHGRNSHLSFSVESQRYVSTSKHHPEPVYPPLFAEIDRPQPGDEGPRDVGFSLRQQLLKHYWNSLEYYDQCYIDLRDIGVPVKQAREAARAFLPNATPVDFVVTADIRGWREVIEKRDYEGADKEIQAFAREIKRHLLEIAPNSMIGCGE